MSKSKKKFDSELASNRVAYHNYEVLETLEAGIALVGTEVKSLRDGGGQLRDSYVTISGGEAWLRNSFIAHYKHGNIHNHEETRERKLLLHKREIERLKRLVDTKGHTLIALSMYLTKKGFVKAKLGVCRGKKMHDKRSSIKEKSQKREVDRALKEGR